jgi:hypothetical protein
MWQFHKTFFEPNLGRYQRIVLNFDSKINKLEFF